MNWREAYHLGLSLYKDSFKNNSGKMEDIEIVDKVLYMRAWLFHSLLTFTRLVYPLIGISFWQKSYKTYEDREEINQEFVKNSESIVKICLITSTVLGGLLDMLIWKHRKFAIAIFYYECIVLLVHGFVPYDYGAIGDFFALLTIYSMFLGYCCDLGRNGIAIIATYLIQTLLILPKIIQIG